MRRSARAVVLATAFTLSAASAHATELYVAPNGDDSAAGTLTAPLRTLTEAATRVHAGDTVYARGGTYHETLNVTASGEASQWITFASYPGETAVIDATATTGGHPGVFFVEGQHHIRI